MGNDRLRQIGALTAVLLLSACGERQEAQGQAVPDATDQVPERSTTNAAVAGPAPSSLVIPGPDAPK